MSSKKPVLIREQWEWDVDRKFNLFRIFVQTWWNEASNEITHKVIYVQHKGNRGMKGYLEMHEAYLSAGERWCQRCIEGPDLGNYGRYLMELREAELQKKVNRRK